MARTGAWTPDKVRARIRTTQIINRLEAHIEGEVEMSKTQVTAALGLLKKTLPDLQAIEHSGEIATNMTREEILGRLAAIHAAAAAAPDNGAAAGSADADGAATTH